MTIHTMPQRSPEWYAIRAGRLTGSCAADILTTLKSGKEPAARRDLRCKLVAERLTGQPQENGFVSEAMQRGIDKEADALSAYEARTGHLVMPVGFISHDDLHAGCSPDGLVSHDGMVEAKAPKTATHLGYYDKPASLLDEYRAQVVHNLWIAQRSWCDLISFDDRLPEHLRLVIVRYDAGANPAEIASYELVARQFISEVDTAVVRYMAQEVA